MIIVQQVSFCSACTLNICQIPLLDKVLQISKIQLKNCVSVKFGESCIHADVKGNVYLYLYFSTRYFLAKLWSHSYHSSAAYKIRVMKTDEIFFSRYHVEKVHHPFLFEFESKYPLSQVKMFQVSGLNLLYLQAGKICTIFMTFSQNV